MTPPSGPGLPERWNEEALRFRTVPVRVVLRLLRTVFRFWQRTLHLLARLRRRQWKTVMLASLGVALLSLFLQLPSLRSFEIRFRGQAPEGLQTLTLLEHWSPRRRILFVSQTLEVIGPGSPIYDESEHTVRAGRKGVSGTLNITRPISIGRYVMDGADLQWADRAQHEFSYPNRSIRIEGRTARVDYHALDLTTASGLLSVPLHWEDGVHKLLITIDFDPISYVSFTGFPDHPRMRTDHDRCATDVVLIPGVARTLPYETYALPIPRPGQPHPSSATPEVLLIGDPPPGQQPAGLWNERVDAAEWAELKQLAVPLGTVQLTHDAAARTVTLTLASGTQPVRRDRRLTLLAAAPSTTGRRFGHDCLTVWSESREVFNPIVDTVIDGLPERSPNRLVREGTRCSSSDSPRLPLSAGTPAVVTYHTTVWKSPPNLVSVPPGPSPRGDADAFIVPLSALHGLSERIDDAEWDSLRQKAVLPSGVKLTHQPREKSITLVLPDPPPADAALVVGTRSSDHRIFGFDCVRLAPQKAPPQPGAAP